MNSELTLAAALVAGLAGSGHCLAMCGGMAGLIGARRDGDGKPIRRTLAYNLGRLFTYSVGGLLAGLLGRAVGLAAGLGVAAGQLRILSGAIIVLAGLYLLTGRRVFAPFEKLGEKAWAQVAPLAVRQLRREGLASTVTLGMLWGWLPCGMTWSMLAIAAATTSPLQGAGIMAAFGLGTLPAMVTAGIAGTGLRRLMSRRAWRQGAAALLLTAGIWTAAVPIAHMLPASDAGQTQQHHAH